MIHVEIPWLELSASAVKEYAYWELKAEAATRLAIQKWEDAYPNQAAGLLDDSIWGEHKLWLSKNVFHRKCAYCEKSIADHQKDAEHFRPKGSVKSKDAAGDWKKAVIRDPDGNETKHPGYFWLAYDVENLMPACVACNSSSESGGGAKADRFPVARQHILLKELSPEDVARMDPAPWKSGRWDGYYYLRTAALDGEEERRVVHPMFDDPAKHVRFTNLGQVDTKSLSEIGLHTVEVLGLDRKDLDVDRWSEQQKAYLMVLAMMFGIDSDGFYTRIRPALEQYLKGQERFSAAVLDYLEEKESGTPFAVELRRERSARIR